MHFNGAEGRVKLTGEIADYDYNGLITKYRVKVGDEIIRVIRLNDGNPSCETGTAIELYMNPRDIMQF